MDIIKDVEDAQKRGVTEFNTGDTVQAFYRIIEGSRKRVQVFEGTVIKRQGTDVRKTFTVRRISYGVDVERTFPVHSPRIEQIKVVLKGHVRRAKLYYLHERQGKAAKIREHKTFQSKLNNL